MRGNPLAKGHTLANINGQFPMIPIERYTSGELVIAATIAVAAGAILTMLVDTMIPEAFAVAIILQV
ncbi:hypothetical protein B1207_08420 [Legionella quinlivanii]|uniref:Uncharacterized protein n=1 Tax=Legionella quinlivanii TaxID=45073 RepID=A0A364LIF0_9GAMM|nr:hypothetical protein [Legionella quinlivanii]RAP36169.1 hypothetical protein B1207_08420 [Legionella quinlivanii]